jgi:hypothetical protein
MNIYYIITALNILLLASVILVSYIFHLSRGRYIDISTLICSILINLVSILQFYYNKENLTITSNRLTIVNCLLSSIVAILSILHITNQPGAWVVLPCLILLFEVLYIVCFSNNL